MAEQEKYDKVWQKSQYRKESPAIRLLPDIKSRFVYGETILDLGCGTGRASLELARLGYSVQMVDITKIALDPQVQIALTEHADKLKFTEAILWDLPDEVKEADWVLCVDVLEHIPTEYVNQALIEISAKMLNKGYFKVAHFEDHFSRALVGEECHLTVEPFEWWKKLVEKHFKIDGTSDIESNNTIFYVSRKYI